MGLDQVFHKGVETAFKVFKSLQKDGQYIITPNESGWDDSPSSVSKEMKIIPSSFSQKDLKNLRFYSEIESDDVVIMIRGVDIIDNGIRVRKGDQFQIAYKTYSQLYDIKAFDTDPAEALYILLLKEVKV